MIFKLNVIGLSLNRGIGTCAGCLSRLRVKTGATYTDEVGESNDGKTIFGTQNSLGGMFNPILVGKKESTGESSNLSKIVEPDQIFSETDYNDYILSSSSYSNGSDRMYSSRHLELGSITGLEGSEYTVDEDGVIDIKISYHVEPLDGPTRSNKGVLPDFISEEHRIKVCYKNSEMSYDHKDYDFYNPNYVTLQSTKKLWPIVPQYLSNNGRGLTKSTKDLNNSYSTRVDEFTTTFVRPAEVTATLDFLSSKKYCVVAEVLKVKLLKRMITNDSYSNLSVKGNQDWSPRFGNIEVISRSDFGKKTATPLNKLIQNGGDDDSVVFISQSEIVTVAACLVLMNSELLPIELSDASGRLKHIDGGLCFGNTNMTGKFKVIVEDVNAFNIVLSNINQSTYMNAVLIDRIYEFLKECFMIGEADRLANQIILNIPLQFKHLNFGKNLLSCPKTVVGRLTGGFRVIDHDGATYSINSYKYVVHDVLRHATNLTITAQISECYRDTLMNNSRFSQTIDSNIEKEKKNVHEKFINNFSNNSKVENFIANTLGTKTPDVPELISCSLLNHHVQTICNQPLKNKNSNVSGVRVTLLGGMGLQRMTTNSIGKLIQGLWVNKVEQETCSSNTTTDILTRIAWSMLSNKSSKYSPLASNVEKLEFFTKDYSLDLKGTNLDDEILVANKDKFKISLKARDIQSKNRKNSCISGSSIHNLTSGVEGSIFGTNNLKKETLDSISVEKINEELYNSHSLDKVATKSSKKFSYLVSVINILLMTQGSLNRDWFIAIKDNVIYVVGTGLSEEVKDSILQILNKCFYLSNDVTDESSVVVIFEDEFDISDYYQSSTGFVYYYRDPNKHEPKTKDKLVDKHDKQDLKDVNEVVTDGDDRDNDQSDSFGEPPSEEQSFDLEKRSPKDQFGKFENQSDKIKNCICNAYYKVNTKNWKSKATFTSKEMVKVSNWYNSLKTSKKVIHCFSDNISNE